MMKTYYVYILASRKHGTLYVGVTNHLLRRVGEYKDSVAGGFTDKYNVKQLVYFEQIESVEAAIAREKQLKNWQRQWKVELIEKENPEWHDVSLAFIDSGSSPE